MKKIIWILLALLAFQFCHGEENGKKEIEFWHAMSGPLGDVLNTMVDKYNTLDRTEYRINAVNLASYNVLIQKLTAASRINKVPDIAQMYEAWATQFIAGKTLYPIQELVDKDVMMQAELNDFHQILLKSCTHNGKLWTFPFNKSVRVMYLNKDLVAQAGYDEEWYPKTTAEFEEFARKCSQDTDGDGTNDIYGYAMQYRSAWQFENLLLSAGGSIIKDNKPMFNSDIGVKVLEYITGLEKQGLMYYTNGYEYQNDFCAGKVGAVEGSSVSNVFMKKNFSEDFRLNICPPPYWNEPAMIVQGTNIGMFKKDNSQDKLDAAWDFIKWFTEKEQTAFWAAGTFYLPVRKSALEDSVYIKNVLDKFPNYKEIINQLSFGVTEPRDLVWLEGREELEKIAIVNIFKGAPIQETLNKAADKISIKKFSREDRTIDVIILIVICIMLIYIGIKQIRKKLAEDRRN